MVTHKPGLKDVGTVEPHPFMRPAFEAAAERAMQAFGDVLQEELRGHYTLRSGQVSAESAGGVAKAGIVLITTPSSSIT